MKLLKSIMFLSLFSLPSLSYAGNCADSLAVAITRLPVKFRETGKSILLSKLGVSMDSPPKMRKVEIKGTLWEVTLLDHRHSRLHHLTNKRIMLNQYLSSLLRAWVNYLHGLWDWNFVRGWFSESELTALKENGLINPPQTNDISFPEQPKYTKKLYDQAKELLKREFLRAHRFENTLGFYCPEEGSTPAKSALSILTDEQGVATAIEIGRLPVGIYLLQIQTTEGFEDYTFAVRD